MDKRKLLHNFGDDYKNEVLNLYEKYELALNKDIPMFGNSFYPPNVWTFFKDNFSTKNFEVVHDGFFEESERRMISFNNNYGIPFPYKVIKIENVSKFNKLNHRDYLGAILSLGINRNKIGDLLVKEEICYVPVCEEIKDFILANLTSVGNVSCKVSLLDEISEIPQYGFKEEIILIQSLRIDSVVSKLAKVSRSKAQTLIEEGKVLINYNRVREKSSDIVEGTRVTIRGIGKFIIAGVIGNSKSGKLKILVKKYT